MLGDIVTAPTLSLPLPERMTTVDYVATALFDAIIAGTIGPGAPLPLARLAQTMGTSMMPIREAVRQLESLGIVDVVPHRGAHVRSLTRADLVDTYYVRAHLETLAVRDAAATFSASDAAAARSALDDQQAALAQNDPVRARRAHERFHLGLYEVSRSDWLMRSILPPWRNAERYRLTAMRNEPVPGKRAAEHRGILAALEAHDGLAAGRLLLEHLQNSVRLVLDDLPDDGTDPGRVLSLGAGVTG
jgi:DNA-binding GntR family transcriptional regulator